MFFDLIQLEKGLYKMLYESIHIENRFYTKLFVWIQIENRLYEMLFDVIQIENMFLVHCKKKNWQIVAAFLIAYKSRMDPRNMNIMRGKASREKMLQQKASDK